jgi:hypothetical protein
VSSPLSATSSTPLDKPLPSLPVATVKGDSPKNRRSLIDAQEKPLRISISPVSGVVETIDWAPLSPDKPNRASLSPKEQKQKNREEAAVFFKTPPSSPRSLGSYTKEHLKTALDQHNAEPSAPSLTTKSKSTQLAEEDKAFALQKRESIKRRLSPAARAKLESTADPRPFEVKKPARKSGAFSSSTSGVFTPLVPRPSSPGPVRHKYSTSDSGRTSPYAKPSKSTPDLRKRLFKEQIGSLNNTTSTTTGLDGLKNIQDTGTVQDTGTAQDTDTVQAAGTVQTTGCRSMPRSESFTTKHLSSTSYGPTLTISDAADRILLGEGSDDDDDEEEWIAPLPGTKAKEPKHVKAVTKTGTSTTQRIVNKVLRKKPDTPALVADPRAIADRILDMSGDRPELLPVAEALVAAITAAHDAGVAREQAIQAATAAERATLVVTEQVARLMWRG